jgi:hypothetical protein
LALAERPGRVPARTWFPFARFDARSAPVALP